MQITDTLESLRLRASWHDFVARFSDHASDALGAQTLYEQASSEAPAEVGTAIAALKGEVSTTKSALENVAELTKDGWVAKKGVAKAEFSTAESAYKKASQSFENFLSGAATHGDAKIQVDGKTSEAFKEFRSAVEKTKSMMGNPFGMARINGWNKIGDTVSHNLNSMKLWEDKVITPKRAAGVAFRGGALVAAGAAIGDSLLRSRDRDGEERGMVKRGLELLAGVGIGTGALLFGRAL